MQTQVKPRSTPDETEAQTFGADAGRKGEDIVHIVERLAPGGIETLVLDLVQCGVGSSIFSLQGTKERLIADWPALRSSCAVIEAFERAPGWHLGLITRIARRLRELKPAAVFAHHMGPLIYGGTAARLARVPAIVYVEHDVWHYRDRRNRVLARIFDRLANPATAAVSQQAADRLRSVVPRKSITVINPGISTDRFGPSNRLHARARLGLDPQWKIVGVVGRLVPVKGHAFLISALSELPDDVHAVFVGGGPLAAELAAQAERRGISNRTHFFGHRENLEQIYPAFDVFCLPSLAEGLPRSLLEAQACGIAAIASCVGGVPEATCPRSGVLVEPGDAGALAAALSSALNRAARPSPREFVQQGFDWTSTVAAYRAIAVQ